MEILQEIGSYAGFAAFVGLAVLSALYFSQARDVKRLREWAGRAPERTTTPPAQTQRVVAQPIPRAPGQQPAAARAAATGAAPAMAQGPAPTTPAAAQAVDGDGDDDDDEADSASASEGEGDVTAMDTVVHPPPAQDDDERSEDEDREREQGDEESGDGPDAADEDRGDAGDDTGEWDPEDTGEWGPEDEHSDVGYTDERDVVPATPAASAPQPPQPPRPYPRRPLPAAGAQPGRGDRTAVLPPYAESRPQAGAHGGSTSRGRRPLAIAAAAIVALALAGFAALQLTAGDDEPTTGGLTTSEPAAGTSSGPVDPGDVTVAVLNGTTVPGLAAALGDQLDNQGFRLGTVTNNFDQARAESVVLYAPAAEREAAAVGRRLDISQREPIDPSSQSLAGDASVVVVAGADQNQ